MHVRLVPLRLLVPILLGSPLLACTGNADDSSSDTPPGLDPLEANTASLPDDESVSFSSSDADGFNNTHARGRVIAPFGDVVICVQTPEVGVDRRRVSEFSVNNAVDPNYEVSYDVLTTVEDIVTVAYTLTWVQGEREDASWGARWTKAEDRDPDVNANLLEDIEGSVLVQAIDDSNTDVGIIEHLDATMTSTDDTEQYTGDFYASIVACAHGAALPTY
ncbi:MAG: hypothetical protein EXR69_10370 [Myxococcales bacterium]|nr:hypothetical protein [Myxococcales bacterium]